MSYPRIFQKPWFQEGLQRLLDSARVHRTVLMCTEEDPMKCHRHHLLAEALLGRGAEVLHIRRSGALEPAAAMAHSKETDTQKAGATAQLDLFEPAPK